MCINGGHISSMAGATTFSPPKTSRMDVMKEQSQKKVDEIATDLIRGNFEIESYEITCSRYEPKTTKLNMVIDGRHEVEIVFKG